MVRVVCGLFTAVAGGLRAPSVRGAELRAAGLLALSGLLGAAPRAVDVLAAQLRGVRGRRLEVLAFNVVVCARAASLGC